MSIVILKNAPCKDCTRRKPACQSSCEDYKAFIDDYHARKQYLSCKEADMYLAASKRSRKRRPKTKKPGKRVDPKG